MREAQTAATAAAARSVSGMMNVMVKSWTDPTGCAGCDHCGMDMDMAPYCVHPDVLKEWPNGVNLNMAIAKFCTPELKLWKKRETRNPRFLNS